MKRTGRYNEDVPTLEAEIRRLRDPFRACDAEDWQYLVSLIPDGGRGRFWKAVLAEMRKALSHQQSTAGSR